MDRACRSRLNRPLPLILRTCCSFVLGGLAASAAFALPNGEWRFAPHLPGTDLNGVTAVMAYDPAYHRILLAGGGDGGGPGTAVWTLSTIAPAGWALLPSTGGPTSLGFAVNICFDAARHRLLVWDSATSTLWTVTLDLGAHWAGRAVPGPGPHSTSSACAFDAERSQMLVFGGYNSSDYVHAQVWALGSDDTSTWRQLSPVNSGPTGRMNAVAIVDPAEDRLIVSGGRDFTGPMTPRGDVWALSLSDPPAWTALFTADTSASLRWYGQAAAFDTTRRRLLVFGGQGTGSGPDYIHAEVSAFDLDGSHEWSVAVEPDPNRGPIVPVDFVAYDGEHDAVIEYGKRAGAFDYTTQRLALSPAAWTPLAPAQAWPPPRFGQATAYDPARERWLSFGGRYTYYVQYSLPTTTYDDLREFRSGSTPFWDELPVAGDRPPARQYGQMLYDGASDRMILFGGNLTTGIGYPLHQQGTPHFLGDTWLLNPSDPPTWTPVSPAGPGPRDGEVMVLDTKRHRVVLFGGRDSLGMKNDLWTLSLDGSPAWTALSPSGPRPAPRRQAVGTYDPVEDRLVVACGFSGAASLADAWQLRFGDAPLAWTPLLTSGTPPTTGAYSRSFVFDESRRRLLVFGTAEPGDYDPVPEPIWELSLGAMPTWSPLLPEGAGPSYRYGASAAMDPAHDRIAFFGGTWLADAERCMSDHWILGFAPEATVGVEVVLVSAEASPGRVALVWWASGALAGARVERREDATDWRSLGQALAGSGGDVRFVDAGAAAGRRYAYRLAWSESGIEHSTIASWVDVPSAAFSLDSPAPNPSTGEGLVSFVLPSSARATLAVFDLAGRCLESRDVGAMGAGRHALKLGRSLSPGLYLVQLAQGGASVTRKWCVVR